MKCSWCHKEIIRNLTLKEILWPFAIENTRCPTCEKRLVRLQPPCCSTCCKPGLQDPCEDCLHWQKEYPDYDFCHTALFTYDEAFSQWIQQYKFLGDYQLRATFTPDLKNFFKEKQHDIICSIPISDQRFEERGFNQVQAMLEAAQIKTLPLLQKTQDVLAQSKKNRKERLETPQTFKATANAVEIKGKTVWIVDDVYTTGRTMFYAAEALLPFEPAQIRTFSLAR